MGDWREYQGYYCLELHDGTTLDAYENEYGTWSWGVVNELTGLRIYHEGDGSDGYPDCWTANEAMVEAEKAYRSAKSASRRARRKVSMTADELVVGEQYEDFWGGVDTYEGVEYFDGGYDDYGEPVGGEYHCFVGRDGKSYFTDVEVQKWIVRKASRRTPGRRGATRRSR